MKRLTITYDNGPTAKLFHIIEDTGHGGTHEYRCTYVAAADAVEEFLGIGREGASQAATLGSLMDGRLTRITLEAE